MADGARFVWYDLMTHEPRAAREFYSRVFGWEIEEMDLGGPGPYTLWRAGSGGFGGVVPVGVERDMPSHWLGYVAVPDVDAAVESALAAGGRLGQPAVDLADIGRFAVVLDPAGGATAPWTGHDDDALVATGEVVCWRELLTPDVPEATGFYGAIYGWESREADFGGIGPYTLLRAGEEDVAGVKRDPLETRGVAAWLMYFRVEDLDATAAAVEAAGGRLLVPPSDLAGMGRFATAADPTGAEFGVVSFGG